MKKFIIAALMMFGMTTASFAQSAQVLHLTKSMNVSGWDEPIQPGYYSFGKAYDGTMYISIGQEEIEIPAGDYEYETWSAEDGHGYIVGGFNRSGNLNVRKSPSTNAPVVAKIKGNKGAGIADEDYECLGVSGDWYKINVHGKVGYIRKDLVKWSICMNDAAGEIR